MAIKHKWMNIDDTRRCIYCDIRWHPSREDLNCQANFPPPQDDLIYMKDNNDN